MIDTSKLYINDEWLVGVMKLILILFSLIVNGENPT